MELVRLKIHFGPNFGTTESEGVSICKTLSDHKKTCSLLDRQPVLRKHASKKSEDQAPSYAQMHLDKTAATQAEAAEASRSEMFGKSMRRFKVTDHLEGSAVIPASHSPDAPYAGMDARASETKTHAVAGLDVRHRRQERRHGDDHISQSATWLTDAHTPLPHADSSTRTHAQQQQQQQQQQPRQRARARASVHE